MEKIFDINSYDYQIDDAQISCKPLKEKLEAKLLFLNHQHLFEHKISDLAEILPKDSILVINNTKVIPARLICQKLNGTYVELLLLSETKENEWQCKILRSRKLKINEVFFIENSDVQCQLLSKNADHTFQVVFKHDFPNIYQLLEQFGYAPLPPYIRKKKEFIPNQQDEIKEYQTIFAQNYGAVAAPTAGLHFNQELLEKLKKRKIQIEELTLHVGLGTFEPVNVQDIRNHTIHEERYSINEAVIQRLNQARMDKKPIVAVGTTSLRVLETIYQNNQFQIGSGKTNIFIHPPMECKSCDYLFTNFHLPKSTLLMFVSAFAGVERIKHAYQFALQKQYRFFSYGDAMLIKK